MKYEDVKKAKYAGNTEALSGMGAAGGRATAEKRRRVKEREEVEALADEIKKEKEEFDRAVQANEHIVLIDSDVD